MRVRLTRSYMNMLSHHGGCGTHRFSLCNDELRRYFDISLECNKIDLVLSTKGHRHAYEVRQHDNCNIIVEDSLVWVDDEFATLIGEYAPGRRKYLSFEYPEA